MYMRSRSAPNSADSAPPSPRFDFEDDVSGIVGVARDQEPAHLFLCFGEARFEVRDFFGKCLVFTREFASGFEITPELDPVLVRSLDLAEFGVAPVHLLGARRIGVQRRIGEVFLQLRVLCEQSRDLFEHVSSG